MGDFMRLKYVKDAKEQIANAPDLILDIPRGTHTLLNQIVPSEMPIEVEIGAGKGQFIHQLSQQQPGIFHIAFEKFDGAIIKALHKCQETPRNNVLLIRADAENIVDFFTPNSVEKIYLNFSDPWPKARHEKRRLTNQKFLNQYKTILKQNGSLVIKTDNRHLFEYSLIQMNACMQFEFISLDLHADDIKANIVTEFEKKHAPYGPIYTIKAQFKEDNQ